MTYYERCKAHLEDLATAELQAIDTKLSAELIDNSYELILQDNNGKILYSFNYSEFEAETEHEDAEERYRYIKVGWLSSIINKTLKESELFIKFKFICAQHMFDFVLQQFEFACACSPSRIDIHSKKELKSISEFTQESVKIFVSDENYYRANVEELGETTVERI